VFSLHTWYSRSKVRRGREGEPLIESEKNNKRKKNNKKETTQKRGEKNAEEQKKKKEKKKKKEREKHTKQKKRTARLFLEGVGTMPAITAHPSSKRTSRFIPEGGWCRNPIYGRGGGGKDYP